MSRFYNYPEAEELQNDDVFLIDGETDGTRKIPANKMADFFGEQVPTDKTLSIENKAADAKKTGDEIGELKSAFTYANTEAAYTISVAWESGTINTSTGEETENANYSRTEDYISTANADYVYLPGANLLHYDLVDGSYVLKANKYVRLQTWPIDKRYGYFRITGAIKIANHPENSYFIYKNTKTQNDVDVLKSKMNGGYVADLYIANGGTVTWHQTNSNTSLEIGETIRFVGIFTLSITKQAVLDAAEDYGLTVTDGVITGSNNYAIMYNVTTGAVTCNAASATQKTDDTIVLFAVYFGSYVYGKLVEYEIKRRYEATQKRITSLESTVDQNLALPDYWQTYVADRISYVTENDIIVGNHGDSFVFCTDQHFTSNSGYSAGIINYILNNSSVNNVFMGGDLINGRNSSKQDALDDLVNARDKYIPFRPKYLRGNHDNNTEISDPSSEKAISDSELYGILLKPIENEIVANKELYYYYDNDAQKIRYICLDTGHPDTNVISDAQITWMQNRITELASGWSAVVITHQFYGTPPTEDGNGTKIREGLDAIYDTADATIVCVIAGHSHADASTTSAKGYPIIATTCDTRGGGGATRNSGTTDEQALDVFHIDTTNRKIYATRFGFALSDTEREWTY